jgi:UBX domain-containing protein 1
MYGVYSGLSVIGPEHVQSSLERIMGRAERSAEVDTANSKKLTIYRNGIVINDGEFLSFEDERNRNLLRDLERGEVPRALRSGDTSVSGPVDVVIDDKHEEEYRAPAYVAFSGESKTSGYGAYAV